MATNEGLSLRIGATVDELRRGLAQAKAIISGTTKDIEAEAGAVENAGKRWNQLGKFIFQQTYERKRMIQQVQQGIGAWKLEAKAIEDLSNRSIPKLQGGVRGATSTLTSFSRIVQDAPYGIIGIGNNITQFAEQLQYLTQRTGSTSAALKAMGASILGTGGITLGISLLVTAVTTLTQKYGTLGAAIQAILTPLSEQAKLQREIRDTLLSGAKEAQNEISQLDALYRSATNVNVPMAERIKIVSELQSKYPAYFENFSKEEVLAGKAASAYRSLKDSIIAAAQARAIENKIAENSQKLLDLDIKRDELNKKITEAAIKAGEAQKTQASEASRAAASINSYGIASVQANTRSEQARSAVASLTDELRRNGQEVENINNANGKYLQKLDELVVKNGAATFKIKDTTKAIKEQRTELEKLDLDTVTGRQDIFQREEPISIKQPIDISLINVNTAKDKLASQVKTVVHDASEAARIEGYALGDKLSAAINDALGNLSIDALSSLGDVIGASLAGSNDGIQNAIKNFVGVLGGYMQNVGKQMIVWSGVLQGFQVAIRSLNPYVAAIAGAAAVAAGAALKSYAQNIPSFATGGGVFGPTMAMIGDNPGREEYVIPSEVLDKLGGNGAGFVAETRISGNDLFVLVKKAGVNYGRINS